MNKRTTLAVVASIVALSVTGCASSPAPSNSAPAPAPAPAPYEAPAPYDPPVSSSEDTYYSVIEDRFPGVSKSTAVTLGRSVCSALDTGASIVEVGQIAVRSGFSYTEAGYIVGAAIGTFCPEYESDARDLIGN